MSDWRYRSACKVAPELFHPERGNRNTAGRALHICLTHCPVLAECRADVDGHPPSEPQVVGGRRYVSKGNRAAVVESKPTIPWPTGCPICRGVS